MSNADLIERLRYNFGRQFVPPKVLHQAADALAAADKRIAELEHKLDVAREALTYYADNGGVIATAALAQIGGE